MLKIFFKRRRVSRRRRLHVPTYPIGLPEKEYLERKKDFLKIAEDKVEFFNQFYDFQYGRISIRNQKTRWGSCSSKGNLNFNYRIFLLDETLMDYVIVHEIAHLKELNHSKDFWLLVEQQLPDYKERIKRIKQYYFSTETVCGDMLVN